MLKHFTKSEKDMANVNVVGKERWIGQYRHLQCQKEEGELPENGESLEA